MTPGSNCGWAKITFDRICLHFRSINNFFFDFFSQNACRRPFWITENHFWSHLWPFQINTSISINDFHQISSLVDILYDWKLVVSIAFLAISDQYATLIFFTFPPRPFWMTEHHFRLHFSLFRINTQLWPPVAILDDRKSRSIAFLNISDQYKIKIKCFHKIADAGHFGWPKITFDCFSRHFRSIRNLTWPFWMTENHFRLHFTPFQR